MGGYGAIWGRHDAAGRSAAATQQPGDRFYDKLPPPDGRGPIEVRQEIGSLLGSRLKDHDRELKGIKMARFDSSTVHQDEEGE